MVAGRSSITLIVLGLLAACAGMEPLPPTSADVPAGTDLSGQWQLRSNSRDSNRQIEEAERQAAGARESRILESRKSLARRKPDDIQVHVFLEAGESLKLTQTEHGLFVSFDRAIVEEYRFGEQRAVTVGPVAADRVSGWENGAYVIETRDKEGAMLIESYRLESESTMIREIRIVNDEVTKLDVSQVFDRR